MSKGPSYKVVYFNGRGRAEPARMMLTLAGKDFEDERFEPTEWPKKKEDTTLFPTGQCPVLVIDGMVLPQSGAIYRYLAKELGFYGDNNMEAAEMDVVMETATDIFHKTMPFLTAKDEAKKVELMKEFKDTTTKPFFLVLEKTVTENGGKNFVGKKVSIADMVIFNMLDLLTNSMYQVPGLLDAYPGLVAYVKSIKEESVLSSYLKARKDTMG